MSVLVGVEGVGHGLLQLSWCTSSFPGKKGARRGPGPQRWLSPVAR